MAIRNLAFAITVVISLIGIGSLFMKGLNFGLDFTAHPDRVVLREAGQPGNASRKSWGRPVTAIAVVQSFGATTDVLVRLAGEDPQLGNQVAASLRKIDADTQFTVEARRVRRPASG